MEEPKKSIANGLETGNNIYTEGNCCNARC